MVVERSGAKVKAFSRKHAAYILRADLLLNVNFERLSPTFFLSLFLSLPSVLFLAPNFCAEHRTIFPDPPMEYNVCQAFTLVGNVSG